MKTSAMNRKSLRSIALLTALIALMIGLFMMTGADRAYAAYK